jgi:hypothetical protein
VLISRTDYNTTPALTPPTDFDRFFNVFLLRISLGFLLVVLGLGYLLDPKAILRLNAMMRDTFFKDSHVLLNGKRIGSLLIVLGFVLLALGYQTRIP